MIDKIHINISILAGVAVTIVSLIYNVSLLHFAFNLTITLCVFFLIGCLVKQYLKNKIFVDKSSYFYEDETTESVKTRDKTEESETE